MSQIRSITELGSAAEISELCHEQNEPIIITKDGCRDMVVMSVDAYEALMEDIEIDRAIAESEAELRETGICYDARAVFDALEKKYFG